MIRIGRLVVLVVALAAGPVVGVAACDCLVPSTTEDRLELATAVFSGRVVDVEVSTDPEWSKTYRFQLIRSFKGTRSASIVLRHDGTDCAFDFEQGASYLVFAYGRGFLRRKLSASICSGTLSLHEAAGEIEAIDRILGE